MPTEFIHKEHHVPFDKPPTATALAVPVPEVDLMTLTAFDDIEAVEGTIPCRSYDPEVFFAESPADVEYAKALCGECPVRAACLQGALERREPWGVWGGELFIQGVVVARKRPRGRPRKNEVAA